MGSYWSLTAGRRQLLWGKNYVPDQLMLNFTDRDRFVESERYAALEALWESEADEVSDEAAPAHLFCYKTTAAALRARLSLQGFGLTRIKDRAIRYFAAEKEDPDRYVPDGWEPFEERYAEPEALLRAVLTWRIRRAFTRPDRMSDEDRFLSSHWEDLVEVFDDRRFELALVLSRTRDATKVVLDLTDLLLGGYLEVDEVPHRTARVRSADSIASNGPVIVVTEGRTDARWMRRSLELAAPELADAFTFLDFESNSAPGGVDRVVSLTRGMAAAQVMNRVIAVLDNDTAGRAGAQQLAKSSLPARTTVTLLPDLDYAKRYPTVGPDGRQHNDVNGRAVTIEMMFGPAIIQAAADGTLPAVRWTGYNRSLDDYQGELQSKSAVQELVDQVLRAQSLGDLEREVAAGCRQLATMLIDAAADATPPLASDSSPLLEGRMREEPVHLHNASSTPATSSTGSTWNADRPREG